MTAYILDTTVLDRITRNLKSNTRKVGLTLAHRIEQEAKRNIETKDIIDTGALWSSVYVRGQQEDGYSGASSEAKGKNPNVDTMPLPIPTGNTIANVGPCVDYAAPIEFGHVTKAFTKSAGCQNFVAARPFLVPACETVERQAELATTWKELFE